MHHHSTFHDLGRERLKTIFVRGVGGDRPAVPTGFDALEDRARAAMSREAFAYVAGGAGRESTIRANREAFDRWRIVPRVLRDVTERDLSVRLFDRTLPAPLLLAPVGVLELAHPEADLAVARAAASLGVPMIFSNQASVAMETCAAVMGTSPRWFQLYWSRSDALVESFVHRAEACGCDAIVLTLDTTMLGWRPRDLDLAYLPFARGMGIAQYTSDPVFRDSLGEDAPEEGRRVRPRMSLGTMTAISGMIRRYPGTLPAKVTSGEPRKAVQRFIATYSRPSLHWEDIRRLRRMTRLKVLLKGVLHPDDARRAVDTGADGLVVSNHGGRQVDGAIATMDALPSVVEAAGGRVPVLLDSGVRGGADMVKALALGATAVLLGRPYVYGLALAGEAGVREVMENVVAEFDLTLGLAGCVAAAGIERGVVQGPS
ncbi:MAG TPA: alpha-hydroxy-acid oxidizing protein [Gemmatimonadales bacterium]|nr:alpha-hydroxy-acid oxidizing protein [Gemmatimonadales bacterium]